MDKLLDVRRDVAKFVGLAGECQDSENVVTAINDARRILYPLGDWKDTVEPILIKCQAGFFTLPGRYDFIKAVKPCYDRNVQVHNEWFEVLENYNQPSATPLVLQSLGGQFSTFRDWPLIKGGCDKSGCTPNGFFIRLFHEDERDCGVEIVFDAWSFRDQNISLTRALTGPMQNIDALPGDPPINGIRAVTKPKTHGRIRVIGYDGVNSITLAIYESGEVNPAYRRYAARGFRTDGYLYGKAKKKYQPVSSDSELVDIHTEALIHALQAITDRESRNLAGFASNLKMATDFLAKEIATPLGTSMVQMKMSEAYRVEGLHEY